MNIAKMFKRTAAMGMALATVMSCAAVSAGAAEVSTVTANVYVDGADNTILEGTTAYFTPSGWTAAIRPTKPSTNNATKTVNDDGTITIDIPLSNTIFRFISFPGGSKTYTGTGWTATATDTDNDTYADKMSYTFTQTALVEGKAYRVEDCNCYAAPAKIVEGNDGEVEFAVSMMVGQTPS